MRGEGSAPALTELRAELPWEREKREKGMKKEGKKVNFCEGLAEIPIFGALTDDFVLLFWGKKAEK